ncbi:hypothetical protein HK103_007395 [Boothiomyces macroporosus]|uniref:Uncharacterized protein n=1 Tax=Boothiomyces macroporosus TaxID=261099 RepID=A0AAD5UPC8_9FUNG|nr:hypothetical protein HK103_007395 [Boothiomyces macroporosus]
MGTRQRSQFNPKRITDEYRNYFESVWKQVLERTFSTLTPEYGPKVDEYGDVDGQELDNLIFDEMKRLQVALH